MNQSPSQTPLGRHSSRLARLRRIIQREEKDLTVVDGLKLAVELAKLCIPIVELYGEGDALAEIGAEPALQRVLESGRAHLVDARTLTHLAPTRQTQGLLAVVACPSTPVRPDGVVIYLDRVQDPGNVGAVIRCAAAFGASGVACSPGCADPFSPRSVRASGGQALLLLVEPNVNFAALAARFIEARGQVAATVGAGGTLLRNWKPRVPLLLAFGNEGQGLAPEVVAACRSHVHVPLAGGVESLNVAVTAGIVLASLVGLAGNPILKSGGSKGGPR
jgi:TrmH family RNA methyltransferase